MRSWSRLIFRYPNFGARLSELHVFPRPNTTHSTLPTFTCPGLCCFLIRMPRMPNVTSNERISAHLANTSNHFGIHRIIVSGCDCIDGGTSRSKYISNIHIRRFAATTIGVLLLRKHIEYSGHVSNSCEGNKRAIIERVQYSQLPNFSLYSDISNAKH